MIRFGLRVRSGGFKLTAVQVESGKEVFEISRVRSGRIRRLSSITGRFGPPCETLWKQQLLPTKNNNFERSEFFKISDDAKNKTEAPFQPRHALR